MKDPDIVFVSSTRQHQIDLDMAERDIERGSLLVGIFCGIVITLSAIALICLALLP